jgi:hypothetical protein
MTTPFAQWPQRGSRLFAGRQAAATDAAVAVIPAVGPLPPVLVRVKLESDPEH